ncbi:hypothetical protein R5R35_001048 [Gryllus longicercus]|uniref:Doublecortin domain-containing protein n=1 Tax=Gryllus longicercus TaxID=2509291 RepID=A0AAN9VF51_9ORTH
MLAPQVLVQPSSRAPSRLQEHLEAEAAAAAAAEGGLGDDSDSALAAADGDDASERADEAGAPEDAAGAAPQPRPPSQAQQRGSGGGGGAGKGAASAGRHAHAHALANGTGPGPAAGNGLHAPRGRAPRDSRSSEDEDFDDDFADADHLHQQQQQQRGRRAGPARRGGFWGQSRPPSPGGSALDMGDPAAGDAALRPKSRADGGANMAASKYSNLSYWRARKVTFYRNGDPFFPGVEFRFKPGRDISSIEAMLDKLSLRMDLPRGARYLFSMDGERRLSLEELEDGGSYVVSSYKTFKVSARGRLPLELTRLRGALPSFLVPTFFVSVQDLQP